MKLSSTCCACAALFMLGGCAFGSGEQGAHTEDDVASTGLPALQCNTPSGAPGSNSGVYYGKWPTSTSLSAGSVLACHALSPAELWNGSGSPPADFAGLRAARAIQYRFVTRDASNGKVPATALLLVPLQVPAANQLPSETHAPSPVIALVTGTAGLADTCAPSLSFRRGQSLVNAQARLYLNMGFTVVIVDYLGLGTELGSGVDGTDYAYLEGPSAGHVIVDALRAARRIPGGSYLGATQLIPASWPLAVSGTSAGGHASLWATVTAPADNVALSASVAGAPPVDLAQTLNLIDSGAFRPLNAFVLAGYAASTDPTARPTGTLESLLTPQGLELVGFARTKCITDFTLAAAPGVLLGKYHLRDLLKDVNALRASASFRAWQTKNSLAAGGQSRFPTPTSPVFAFHGLLDQIVPHEPDRQLFIDRWGAQPGGAAWTGDANLPRAKLAFQTAPLAEHLTVGSLEHQTVSSDVRYAPWEWLFDGVFGAERNTPDASRCSGCPVQPTPPQ